MLSLASIAQDLITETSTHHYLVHQVCMHLLFLLQITLYHQYLHLQICTFLCCCVVVKRQTPESDHRREVPAWFVLLYAPGMSESLPPLKNEKEKRKISGGLWFSCSSFRFLGLSHAYFWHQVVVKGYSVYHSDPSTLVDMVQETLHI